MEQSYFFSNTYFFPMRILAIRIPLMLSQLTEENYALLNVRDAYLMAICDAHSDTKRLVQRGKVRTDEN